MSKPLRKIYLFFAVCSLLMALLATFIVSQKILPYRLKLVANNELDCKTLGRFIFYDLDHDGFKERIEMLKEPLDHYYYIKIYQDYKHGLIDQFNFNHEIVFYDPVFYDINHDGWDDLFVFSNNDDSLYLSIVDVNHVKFLQKERPILAASPKRKGKKWDIHSIIAHFTDLKNTGHPQLLISLSTGYAKLPRCLCLYDLQHHKIARRFDHHMGAAQCAVTDLNKDGFKEIALVSVATNNFPPDVPLSDAYSWFVLLDHQFHYLKPPLKLGGKFTGTAVQTIANNGQNNLLIWHVRNKSEFMIVDSTFRVIAEKEFERRIRSYVLDKQTNPPEIIATLQGGYVATLDARLNLLAQKEIKGVRDIFYISKSGNFIGDEKSEYFCYDKSAFYLFDRSWQLLAKYPLQKSIYIRDVYLLPKSGKAVPDIVVAVANGFILFKIVPEILYHKMTYLFLSILIGIFAILTGGFWIIEKIRQYVLAFFFLLRQSDNAIVLLDYRGRIISVNQKVNRFLRLEVPIGRGDHFKDGFKQRPEIVKLLEDILNKPEQIQKQFSFEDAQNTFVGSVTVTPFFSLFNFVFSYLIEIKDSTEQVLLERQRNWQRNVRKMVHDIKTPIAGVQLKLQMLYQKMADKNCDGREDVCQELEEAHAELKRIRNIAQEFLKFSDLEKLSVSETNLADLLGRALAPFEFFKNDRLAIDVKIDPHLPQTVYWDERQIELLLHILIENAIDAVQGEGKINIEVKPGAKIKKSAQPWIEFRIQDNGVGIRRDIRDKIFEPHFSTKQEGSGMGLSFAKHIVQQHGGEIEFFSDEKSGTLFIIRLPAKVTASA